MDKDQIHTAALSSRTLRENNAFVLAIDQLNEHYYREWTRAERVEDRETLHAEWKGLHRMLGKLEEFIIEDDRQNG